MPRKPIVFVLFAALAVTLAVGGGDWAIEADFSESCNCNPACPCMFGSPPTHGHCEGSRLVEIRKGHYGDLDLSGVKVVMTFRMGAWVKYYVDAPEDRVEAARDLMMATFPSFAGWGIASTERVEVHVERSEETLSFSVPGSTVEIEVMGGRDGKPVRVEHLPSADNYTQYVSKQNSHQSEQDGFEYSGTNGFTATVATRGSTP